MFAKDVNGDQLKSLREFGRIIGVSGVAVGKAVKRGRLAQSVRWVNGKPKIADVDLAKIEWEGKLAGATECVLRFTHAVESHPGGVLLIVNGRIGSEHARLPLPLKPAEACVLARLLLAGALKADPSCHAGSDDPERVHVDELPG